MDAEHSGRVGTSSTQLGQTYGKRFYLVYKHMCSVSKAPTQSRPLWKRHMRTR